MSRSRMILNVLCQCSSMLVSERERGCIYPPVILVYCYDIVNSTVDIVSSEGTISKHHEDIAGVSSDWKCLGRSSGQRLARRIIVSTEEITKEGLRCTSGG